MILVVLMIGAAAFITKTSSALPEVVASHFGASGAANGFLPREIYIRLMVAIVVVVPLLTGFLPGLALGNSNANLRLPNSDYWLAPNRREASVSFIRNHLARFGMLLVVFVCCVHRLVIHANILAPPELPTAAFLRYLIGYLVCVAIWSAVFIARFSRPQR